VALEGTSAAARLGLASALYQLGPEHSDAALIACIDAIAVDEAAHSAVAMAGLLEGERGQVEAALQRFRDATALAPTSALYR
jgi:Flp pilus assembly protein TadD